MKIGWIGTGVMGQSMAGHLQAAGHELFVFNRTKSKAQALVDKGAHYCNSPADVAKEAEVIFAIVGFPPDVEATFLGGQGVLSVDGPFLSALPPSGRAFAVAPVPPPPEARSCGSW